QVMRVALTDNNAYGIKYFSGSIAAIRIHSGVLSSSEVQANFNAGPLAETGGSCLPGPPAAPTALAATPVSSSQINLTWTDNATNENGFSIEQATASSGPFLFIATLDANTSSYASVGLMANTQYWYRVRAYNDGGNSSYSATAQATTPADAPPIVVAGDLLVNLMAKDLASGALSSWGNPGTLGGSFAATGTAPQVGTVAGNKAVTFSGANGMISNVVAPASITGSQDWSVEVWAYNPSVASEECMVQWAERGTTSRCAQFNYGTSTSYGAATHYGNDMRYTTVPAAGAWHHLVLTFTGGTGGTEQVYVDGVLNRSRTATLNLFSGQVMRVALTDNNAYGIKYFSGSIAAIRIHSGVLSSSDAQANFNAGPAAGAGGF
ncbi:MAG: fibronectin type III domain-containing protein, partial [Chitinispirillaceae bacterium]|nr:fibronectin type III domain-containing protein [Chitinispirillaceae bacterium]